MFYYLTENQFIHVPKILHLPLCVTFLKNISIFPKWSCVLNCCSECTGVFVLDAEMNDEDDANIPFIQIHHCVNISSCSLHKHVFTEHGKICPSCMNIENAEKRKNYNTEKYCTEIMQHFGSSTRILNSSH